MNNNRIESDKPDSVSPNIIPLQKKTSMGHTWTDQTNTNVLHKEAEILKPKPDVTPRNHTAKVRESTLTPVRESRITDYILQSEYFIEGLTPEKIPFVLSEQPLGTYIIYEGEDSGKFNFSYKNEEGKITTYKMHAEGDTITVNGFPIDLEDISISYIDAAIKRKFLEESTISLEPLTKQKFTSIINSFTQKIPLEFFDKYLKHSIVEDLVEVLISKRSNLFEQLMEHFPEEIREFIDKDEVRQRLNKQVEYNLQQILYPPQMERIRAEMGKNRTQEVNSAQVRELLLGDKVLEDISKANIPGFLTPIQIADVLYVTKLLDKYFRGEKIVEGEKEKLEMSLTRIIKDPTVKENLEHIKFLLTFINPNLPAYNFIERYIDSAEAFKLKQKEIDKDLSKIMKVNTKLKALLERIERNEDIPKEDKLTLEETGILTFAERYNGFVASKLIQPDGFKSLGPLNLGFDPAQKKWLSVFNESRTLAQKLMELSQMNEFYKDGNLLVHNVDLMSKIKKDLYFLDKLTIMFTGKYTHAGKIFHDDDGNCGIAEMVRSYQQQRINLYEMCISDIYEFDVTAIVDPRYHSQLQQKFGEDWKNIINKRFQGIEKELHRNESRNFYLLENNVGRIFMAGLADYRLAMVGLGVVFHRPLGGHVRTTPRTNFEEIHAQFYNPDPDAHKSTEFICSEFATKSTIAAMVELNKQLSKDLGMEEVEVVKIPFSKSEILQTVHPTRMVNILTESGCIKKVIPPALSQAINFE